MMMSDLFDTEKFEGNHSVADLRQNRCAPPRMRGVYVVRAPDGFKPTFLEVSPATHLKGRGIRRDGDPTIPIAELEKLWVRDTPILYIGKAGAEGSKRMLRKRIQELLDFGEGKKVKHWGGRALWQVEGSEQFIISWRQLPDEDPYCVEQDMIDKFARKLGKPPFANLT
jgi:hypothetical protein